LGNEDSHVAAEWLPKNQKEERKKQIEWKWKAENRRKKDMPELKELELNVTQVIAAGGAFIAPPGVLAWELEDLESSFENLPNSVFLKSERSGPG